MTESHPISEVIREKLTLAFAPTRLELVDDSDRHHGHAGHSPGGGSHFNLLIETHAFTGVNRVARQRQVYAVLSDELASQVHALSVKALAPGEA